MDDLSTFLGGSQNIRWGWKALFCSRCEFVHCIYKFIMLLWRGERQSKRIVMGLMKLLRENEDVVECEHIPMTARYVRALHRLPRILRSGKAIARRQLSPISAEVVVVCGRRVRRGKNMICTAFFRWILEKVC